MPFSWGLKGEPRKLAQANYELSDEELEREIIKIKFGDEPKAFAEHNLAIDLTRGKIDQFEFELKLAELNGDAKAVLSVKLKFNKISQKEYDKDLATLNGDPWVDISTVAFDKTKPGNGSLELDWNQIFVDTLSDAGYVGKTDEEVVDLWLTDLCKNIALEALDGVGTFNEDADHAAFLKRTKLEGNRSEIR